MKPEWHDRCCCNCQNQRVIFKHPWNKGDGKGGFKDVMGYGCAPPDFELDGIQAITFKDFKHGHCEMHYFK